MKTAILTGVMLFTSITLFAKETPEEFVLGFTNIEVFNKELVPALSIEVNPDFLDKFDFMIAYASNYFSKNFIETSTQLEKPKVQNMYIAMNYKF